MQEEMEAASPEAFRQKFTVARRRRQAAVAIVTTTFVVIGWGIVRIFIDDLTRETGFWMTVILLPIGAFGWLTGRRIGNEFEYDVWKEFRLSQMLSVGARRQSLDDLMGEVLGEVETYRRRQEAERTREAADSAPPAPSGTGTGPAYAPPADPAPSAPREPEPPNPPT